LCSACEVSGDGFVGEIAGGDDVRKQAAALAAHAQALGQVDLDEVAISSAKPAERVESLHDSGAPGSTESPRLRPATQRRRALGKGIQAGGAMAIVVPAIRLGVLNETGNGQAVLRQADAAGTEILADLFVLQAVEAVVVEEGLSDRDSGPSSGIVGRRAACGRRAFESCPRTPLGAAGRGEALQFGAADGGH
jgi:hypothetical protein